MQQQNPECLLSGLLLLVFVGFAGWRIGGHLSSDAMGMAVGMHGRYTYGAYHFGK